MASWAEATAVQQLDSHTYSCTFYEGWCIGTVPNGGYVTGCLLEVVSKHFNTTLAKQNQPHTIALHVEFLRRTQVGPATFTVEDAKIGRQTSVVHVNISQEGRQELVAYVTNSNMHTEEGVSFETDYQLHPPRPAVDLSKLQQDEDANWKPATNLPYANIRKVMTKTDFYLPRNAENKGDQWVCHSDGSNFTDSSIGFVADIFPLVLETFRSKWPKKGTFWYPTLLLNLDIKKTLPPGGVKWLGNRVQIKKMRNGRMDLEVQVFDAEGDVVALSHHVALMVDMSRNTAQRRQPDSKM